MSFSINGVVVDTSGFEKALKTKKANIESHAKYPVQAQIENKIKSNYRLMLKTSCTNIIKYLSNESV